MSRPIYESEVTQRAEKLMIERALKAWGLPHLAPTKLPMKERLDWALKAPGKDSDIETFVECKQRHITRDRFDTFMVSKDKWLCAADLHDRFGTPFTLLVQYTDGLYALSYPAYGKPTLRIGGRSDRGDPNDIELMAHFDVKAFEKIA